MTFRENVRGTWKNSESFPRSWDLGKIPNSPPLCRLWDLEKIRAIPSIDMKHVSIAGTWMGIFMSLELRNHANLGHIFYYLIDRRNGHKGTDGEHFPQIYSHKTGCLLKYFKNPQGDHVR